VEVCTLSGLLGRFYLIMAFMESVRDNNAV
jgi:hypothetical protein